MATYRFHVIDYVVFAVTIVLSMAVGLIFAFRGGQKTNQEYLVGNRKMKVIPVAASILVSYVSTLDILGNPAEVYGYGSQYMLLIVAQIIGILVGTFVFVPLYYPLNITSVFEYHRMRFRAPYVEYFGIVLAVLMMLMFNAMTIYSPCMAFEAVSGFPAWASMLISGLAAIFYTTLGGMQAVVWSDCFQALVIIGGLLGVLIKGTLEVGGVAEVWRINDEWGRLKFFDLSPDPTKRLTFWSVVIANSFLWLSVATNQPSVQRFVALPTMAKAKMSSLLAMPGFVISGLLTCSCGLTAFAYYAKKGCDPVTAGLIIGPNEIMPHFVMDVLDIPALPGLFIACLFSASLSSLSSCYSAFAAILWQNCLQHRCSHLPANKQTRVTKLATLLFGLVSISAAFLVMHMGGTLIQIAYTLIGCIDGPLFGMWFLAGFHPRMGPRGIFVGMVLGFALCIWMAVGANVFGDNGLPLPGPTYNCSMGFTSRDNTSAGALTGTPTGVTGWPISSNNGSDVTAVQANESRTWLEWMYSVSYFYYPLIGVLVVAAVSIVFSVIPGLEPKQHVPKKLLFPFSRYCCGDEDESEITTDDKELELLHKPGVNDNDIKHDQKNQEVNN